MTFETINIENEYGSSELDGRGPDIDDEEASEVRKFMKEFYRYKKYRSRYDKNYMDYYKMFRGVQWSSRRPYWRNSEIINMIWQVIQSQVPLQTDVRPTWEFVAKEPNDVEFADILNSIAKSDFGQKNWMNVLLEVIYDGWIYGTSYSSMEFDPSLDHGLGSAVFRSEDPFYCYPDPASTDVNCPDSRGFFRAKPIETSRLREMHPDRADMIKPDVRDIVRKERTELKDFKLTHFSSDVDLPEGTYGSICDNSKTDMTFVIDGWFLPKETVEEEFEEEGEDGRLTKKFRIMRKWPRGRRIRIANGMMLINRELDYEDGLIPFSKYNNYILPREFHGVSEVEQLESPQKIFNKMVCFTLDAYAMTGNPVWIVDRNSGVDTDSGIVNVPGSIVEKNPNTEVRRLDGASIAPGALGIIDRLESWFNTNAGISDLQSGEAPGGVTAASAIEQLISIQRTRIRQKQRNLDTYMKTVGRQYMNRVLEFYSVPKIFRITAKDGSIIFRKFRIDREADEQGRMMRVAVWQDVKKDDSDDSQDVKMVELPVKRLIIKGDLDIDVKSGSSLPFEIADIERKSFALFDRNIIDEEEILERLDVPNRERILQRLQERREMIAAQEQQQQQQKG